MKRLFQQRLSKHIVQMTKYLRYVFNDFFVIALIFLMGGLGLAYSNFLKHFQTGQWWLNIGMVLVIYLALQIGKLATLVQDPDYVFLLPRDQSMSGYLKPAFWYSTLNASVVQIILWFLLLPLFKLQWGASYFDEVAWLILLLVLKASQMISMSRAAFRGSHLWLTTGFNRYVLSLALIVLGIWQVPMATLLAMVWLLILIFSDHQSRGPLNWRRLIRKEDSRMQTIYQIFNLFVDVPQIKSSVKRRRYLTPFLNLIKTNPRDTYTYLYWHGFVRDKEVSNLYLRLLIIGMVLLWFLKGNVLPMIVGLLFVYLVGFQLLAFYFHFDTNAFIHLYPLKINNRLISFQKMLVKLLFVESLLFEVIFALVGHSWQMDGLNLVILFIEIYLLVGIYVPKKIKQINDRR